MTKANMASSDPVRVGVLFSETGDISTTEISQLMGTRFAVDKINAAGGICGREMQIVHYDPQSSPGQYRVLVEQLILRDKINVIFGCYLSSTRKAVLPIVEKWNKLLFYPTLYEGFECSSNVIYTGAAPNQNSLQLAEFMTFNYGPRVYLVGSDYIYPYESNRIMENLVCQLPGGGKVGERYVPLGAEYEHFKSIIDDIKNVKPDFIFSTVVGNSTKYLYQAYADAGLNPRIMPIASLTTLEAEVNQMGAGVANGHISSAPYFQTVDREANHKCLDEFRYMYGNEFCPNAGWEAAYFQVNLFAQAMALAGSDSIDELMPYLLGSEFEAPQGRVRVDPTNHHTCLYPRIGIFNSEFGQFEIIRQAKRAINPDPYLISHSLGEWSLRHNTVDG
ncbi:MAG TPA: transporter substrate-binding domain-containing protein [Bellilinea sp.]|nr:transporter substrate-binding domain-containing protein [Bellilinea sp.]